jgi:acetylornithine deacetylase
MSPLLSSRADVANARDSILAAVDRQALVDLAVELVSIPSPTGEEWAMGVRMAAVLEELGLAVTVQEVEEGRANVLGVLEGAGGGPTLMFNGHMDTSYSGEEPWLRGIPGFRPAGFVRDGRIYGLGISNMKGALACYVAALRGLRDAGVRLRGDVMLAAVVGEIEKTQWGDFRGRSFRGYAAGTRHLVSHGGAADVCILGEPTEGKMVLAHFGTLWARISTAGPFVHTAFSAGRRAENSIVRMRDVLDGVLEWAPEWEERAAYGGKPGLLNVGAVSGGFPWRVSRTPVRTDLFVDLRVPPSMPMADARAALGELGRRLREQFPEHGIEWEVYVTAPGAEIDKGNELVAAVDAAHAAVFGSPPERDVVHWFSDASALTRYGVATVNYGTSSGLPDAELGENLDIGGLVDTAKVYALAAARICGVA